MWEEDLDSNGHQDWGSDNEIPSLTELIEGTDDEVGGGLFLSVVLGCSKTVEGKSH